MGVVLGTLAAYAGLLAGNSRDIGKLGHVPVLYLLGIAIGVPLAAAAAGWVFAGREPPVILRHAIE
jgi:putative ABC transport system permease protein